MTRSWLYERFREIPGRGTIKGKIAGEGAWQSWRAEGRPEQWEQSVKDGVAGQPIGPSRPEEGVWCRWIRF